MVVLSSKLSKQDQFVLKVVAHVHGGGGGGHLQVVYAAFRGKKEKCSKAKMQVKTDIKQI